MYVYYSYPISTIALQSVHENILKHHVTNRLAKISEGRNLDWSTAEALAIGSLLYQGECFNTKVQKSHQSMNFRI